MQTKTTTTKTTTTVGGEVTMMVTSMLEEVAAEGAASWAPAAWPWSLIAEEARGIVEGAFAEAGYEGVVEGPFLFMAKGGRVVPQGTARAVGRRLLARGVPTPSGVVGVDALIEGVTQTARVGCPSCGASASLSVEAPFCGDSRCEERYAREVRAYNAMMERDRRVARIMGA